MVYPKVILMQRQIHSPAINMDNEQETQNFDSAETKQNLSMMVQRAVGGFGDIFDIMRFFNIGVEAIDIDPINLTVLNDKKADRYNIVTVNGKRFRVLLKGILKTSWMTTIILMLCSEST